MTAKPVSADYSAITQIGAPGKPCVNTAQWFNRDYVENSMSAIDLFIENCKEINKLLTSGDEISPELGRLLLLGYVSAVESFFRTILRSIINTDAQTKAATHSLTIPFGAALYHDKKMIAEALLEEYSFSGEKGVNTAITKFLQVPAIPEDLKSMFGEYEKICQLRHCCVHRFGKLGTKNGIVLGLEEHSAALEKPLSLNKIQLESIASWLMSFTKAMNNYMFQTLLDRSISVKNPYQVKWQWSYAQDGEKFRQIYKLFRTCKDTSVSPTAKELYDRFKYAKRRSGA